MTNDVNLFAIGFLPIHLFAIYLNLMIILGYNTDGYSVNTAIFLLICVSMGTLQSLYNVGKLIRNFWKKHVEERTHGMVED